jgi:hypothetical protein
MSQKRKKSSNLDQSTKELTSVKTKKFSCDDIIKRSNEITFNSTTKNLETNVSFEKNRIENRTKLIFHWKKDTHN